MAKIVFLVCKHARDLAASYLAQVTTYYVEALELYAGLREPAPRGTTVTWMEMQPGDNWTAAAAAVYKAAREALSAAHAGHSSLNTIRLKFEAEVFDIRGKYEGCDSVIDAVMWRVEIVLDDLDSAR